MSDPDQWVCWITQTHYYDDGSRDKLQAAMAVLAQWDMTEQVVERAQQAYVQLRARPAAIGQRNRRQEAVERDSGSISRQAA